MKIRGYIDKKIVVSGLIIALGAVAAYCALNNLSDVKAWLGALREYLSPVTWGLVLAYILRPFAKFLERVPLKKLRKDTLRVKLSSLITVVILLVSIYFFTALLLPQLGTSVTNFVGNIDGYIASARALINEYAAKIEFAEVDVDKLIGSSDEILSSIGVWLNANIESFVSFFYQMGSQLLNLVIVIAMSVYALLDRKNLKNGLYKLERVLLGDKRAMDFNQIVKRGDELMLRFLGSNLLDALLIGAVNFVFLSVFKAPYAVLLSVFLGVTNFVPTFGPIFGGFVAGVIMLLTKPSLLIGFVIFTLVLQQIDGNVIKPLLFGDSTGISPFWVLASIVIGGRVFGVMGMILGVPVFALLSSIYTEVLDKRLRATEDNRQSAPPDTNAPPDGNAPSDMREDDASAKDSEEAKDASA